MKKIIYILFVAVFISGCGSPSESKAPMGSQTQTSQTASQAIEDNPDIDRLIQEGAQHIVKGDIPSAIKSFDSAIKVDPKNPKAYVVLGETYMRIKDYSRAVDTLNAALIFNPTYGQGHYMLALAHNMNGDKEMAARHARISIDIFQKNRDQQQFVRSVALLKSLVGDNIEGADTSAIK